MPGSDPYFLEVCAEESDKSGIGIPYSGAYFQEVGANVLLKA